MKNAVLVFVFAVVCGFVTQVDAGYKRHKMQSEKPCCERQVVTTVYEEPNVVCNYVCPVGTSDSRAEMNADTE